MRNLRDAVASTVSSGKIGNDVGNILSYNQNRAAFFVQNLHTGTLYVSYSTVADNNNYNTILKACTTQDDGNGGTLYESNYIGPVSLSGKWFGTGGGVANTPRYLVWELT